MDPQSRIDLPLLVRSLRFGDQVTKQNAGGLLGYYACHNEEHREAIAAQLETIVEPLVAHLGCGQSGLVHNAALLLGQCLMFGTEFRQTFAMDTNGPRILVATLKDSDPGVICNVTWALRHFVSDPKCHLSTELCDVVEESLPPLMDHTDPRIKKHATSLSTLIKKKKAAQAYASARSRSLQAVEVLTSIRGNGSSDDMSAVAALTSLAALASNSEHTNSEDSGFESSEEEGSPPGRPQNPMLKADSPGRSQNPTLMADSPIRSPKKSTSPKKSPTGKRLSPWKKTMALQYTAVKNRNFHAAVNYAAAG